MKVFNDLLYLQSSNDEKDSNLILNDEIEFLRKETNKDKSILKL